MKSRLLKTEDNIMELTAQQRICIVELLTAELTESQTSDTYRFELDCINLNWLKSEEVFAGVRCAREHLNMDITYYSPAQVGNFAESLSDAQLGEWFIYDYACCDPEDFAEYIQDEMGVSDRQHFQQHVEHFLNPCCPNSYTFQVRDREFTLEYTGYRYEVWEEGGLIAWNDNHKDFLSDVSFFICLDDHVHQKPIGA